MRRCTWRLAAQGQCRPGARAWAGAGASVHIKGRLLGLENLGAAETLKKNIEVIILLLRYYFYNIFFFPSPATLCFC